MKHACVIFLLLSTVFGSTVFGAGATTDNPPTGKVYTEFRIVDGDTIWVRHISTVYVFKNKSEKRKYDRLVRNVIKVYPIALDAEKRFAALEQELERIPQKWKQKEYIRKVEKELAREYTPILKQMTFSQGKILIKLIDRQMHRTSYDIVRELRGKFTAAFWQGIARIFDANLKQGYDADGEDRMIEEIIELYEAGHYQSRP